MFKVLLTNVGNPDRGQDPNKKLYGTKNTFKMCETLKECSDACLAYIAQYNLGGSNFDGGIILDENGIMIGNVTYGGRVMNAETEDDFCRIEFFLKPKRRYEGKCMTIGHDDPEDKYFNCSKCDKAWKDNIIEGILALNIGETYDRYIAVDIKKIYDDTFIFKSEFVKNGEVRLTTDQLDAFFTSYIKKVLKVLTS